MEKINEEYFKQFKIKNTNISFKEAKEKVKELVEGAIKKNIPQEKFGVLFSGGIDSTLISFLLKKYNKKFICYTVAFENKNIKVSEDLVNAKKIAKDLDFKLKVIKLNLKQVKKDLAKIVSLIGNDPVKVAVALTLFPAMEQAGKDKCKYVFSGLGSEEIFGGYFRHKQAKNVNKECLNGLRNIYGRDLIRDNTISSVNKVKLKLPFLDKKLIEFCLSFSGNYKIKGNIEKYILREAAVDFGLKEEFAFRKKRAAQYGSNMQKALKKLSGKKKISEYLNSFIKLGALVSSGKDSLYALYLMYRQNYNISCLITLNSRNPDSYMFHTPTTNLVKLQSKLLNIPFIEQRTIGEEEKELVDLKKALIKAIKKYKIQGVITGALFSNYQKTRIEKICNKLNLKVFSPLWHKDQEEYLKELIENNFEVIITAIAADGLDESWLGRKLDSQTLNKLKEIHKKNKINVAFEGGEAETLVLNMPLFPKKIIVEKAEKMMENKCTGKLIIKKVK